MSLIAMGDRMHLAVLLRKGDALHVRAAETIILLEKLRCNSPWIVDAAFEQARKRDEEVWR